MYERLRQRADVFSRKVDLTLIVNDIEYQLKGSWTDRTEIYNPETGAKVNARRATALISMQSLTDCGFSENLLGAILIKGEFRYKISEVLPCNTLGLIPLVCKIATV
jgi:hypothetical protein